MNMCQVSRVRFGGDTAKSCTSLFFKVAELILDNASAPRPTGGVDTSAEYCLPAGQEWQETTMVKDGVEHKYFTFISQTIRVEHEYRVEHKQSGWPHVYGLRCESNIVY